MLGQPAFASSDTLYERFLEVSAPEARRQHGVYFTPPAVVGAQVRLVERVLRQRLHCAGGFADPRVAIVDPATGSGAYPLAILDLVGNTRELRQRMRLFETRPGATLIARARGLPVTECDALSTALELEARIVVCIGNPPYRRRPASNDERAALADLAEPGSGVHRKNLYNDYVYFWRWAVRAACETRRGPAIVCFVTAASYLRGPAFGGLRRLLRAAFDEMWLIDLEGDHLAARASDNVFLIRTPIAIALCARYAETAGDQPAKVYYTRLGGGATEKLKRLEALRMLGHVPWARAPAEWSAPLVAVRPSAYYEWPALTELFPWQLSGAQLKRTWPIGITPAVLRLRWQRLLELGARERQTAFVPTRDRNIDSAPEDLLNAGHRLMPLRQVPQDAPCPEPARYAYRAFDRQWVLPDARCGDFLRPRLWATRGPRQLYLTSMLTNVLGPGPAAVVTALLPDMDHFRGSFGARGVIPLWRDSAASLPNVSGRWLERLSQQYGFAVSPEVLMAYCYALLAAPTYTRRFEEELRSPGPRVPLVRDVALFQRAVALGDALIRLHTFREVPVGEARLTHPIETDPGSFSYDASRARLRVGQGLIEPVSPEVLAFSVSGYAVLRGWLRRRITRKGKSPLDAIGPIGWSAQLSDELLELVWLLEATRVHEPILDALLDEAASRPDYIAASSIR